MMELFEEEISFLNKSGFFDNSAASKENYNKTPDIHDIHKLRLIYKLKSIYRLNSVDSRHESAAEHTWSAMMLADYVLSESDIKINKLKVYELLMYHDLVEIHAGDTPITSESQIATQKEREHVAFQRLIKELPHHMAEKYQLIYNEFIEGKTIEAKFARAIEELDSSIQELDYKKDWIGFSEEFLRKKKTTWYKEFPIIMEIFEEFLKYCNENGFFNQK